MSRNSIAPALTAARSRLRCRSMPASQTGQRVLYQTTRRGAVMGAHGGCAGCLGRGADRTASGPLLGGVFGGEPDSPPPENAPVAAGLGSVVEEAPQLAA